MKKLLITGGGGYIGSIMCYELLKSGYEVVILDNLSTGYRQPIEILQNKFKSKAIRFYKTDLRENIDAIFEKEKKIDAVIHLAGACIIDESMRNPSKYFSNNTLATFHLLESMLRFEVPRILFASSCSVYGASNKTTYSEDSPLVPINPYGQSKLQAEEMIQWFSKAHGLQYIILRYFNVCGAEEKGIFGDSKNPSHLLVHNAILGSLKLRPFYMTYPNFDTKDKSPVRDYIDILDLIDAHLKSLTFFTRSHENLILNIGTGKGYSVVQIIDAVERITHTKLPRKRSKNIRRGEYASRVASNIKAMKTLAWKPKRSIDDSIDSSLLWYRSVQKWTR